MPKNWNDIVCDLLLIFSQTELEDKTGVKQPVISHLANGGAKPNLTWTYGEALSKAHKSNLRKINKVKKEREIELQKPERRGGL